MKSKIQTLFKDVCTSAREQTTTAPVTFADVLEIRNGQNQKKVENPVGQYPIYGSGGVMGRADKFICPAETVVIGRKGSINNPIFVSEPFWNVDTAFGLIPDKSRLLPRYLYYFCLHFDFERLNTTVTIPSLTKANLLKIHIKLPSLPEQQKCVAVLDKIVSILEKRRAQLAALDELVKARFVEMFGDPVGNPMGWEMEELGERCAIVTGNTPSRREPANFGSFIEWIKSDNINTPSLYPTKAQECLSEVGFQKGRYVEAGNILMTCIAGSLGCIGNVAVTDRRVAFNQQINAIVPRKDNPLYLYCLMRLMKPAIHRSINMSLKGILSKGQLSKLRIPLPPLPLQERFASFVARVERLKATIQRSLAETQRLFDSQLQEHFG